MSRSRNSTAAVLALFHLGIFGGPHSNASEPAVFEKFQTVRSDTVDVAVGLIAVLNDEAINSGYRYRAIRNLGDLRYPTAIRPLLNHLTFRGGDVTGVGSLVRYPAAAALVSYGSVIYPSVWAVLENDCSDKYLEVLACTLFHIDGPRVAVVRLEEKLADANLTDKQRQNVESIKRYLTTRDFSDPKHWPR